MNLRTITHRTAPFVARLRGVPVLLVLLLGLSDTGEPVRGLAALYPDGTQAMAVVPCGEPN